MQICKSLMVAEIRPPEQKSVIEQNVYLIVITAVFNIFMGKVCSTGLNTAATAGLTGLTGFEHLPHLKGSFCGKTTSSVTWIQ